MAFPGACVGPRPREGVRVRPQCRTPSPPMTVQRPFWPTSCPALRPLCLLLLRVIVSKSSQQTQLGNKCMYLNPCIHTSEIISLCIYPSIAKAKQFILMCQTSTSTRFSTGFTLAFPSCLSVTFHSQQGKNLASPILHPHTSLFNPSTCVELQNCQAVAP